MSNKYPYPELTTQEYLGLRWYETPNGTFFPSITTILGTTAPEESKQALANWRNSLGHAKADAHSKARADHGTNVHLLAERYLKGEEVFASINGADVPQGDKVAFNALKLKLDKVEEVWGQECALYSNFFEVAGRCDLIGVYKKKPVIIDFKTSGRLKGDKDIYDYKLQLAFYGAAHNEMFGTSIEEGVVLMVAQNGFPLEFTFKLEDFYEPLQTRVQEFYEMIVNKKH